MPSKKVTLCSFTLLHFYFFSAPSPVILTLGETKGKNLVFSRSEQAPAVEIQAKEIAPMKGAATI
ncbi:MAG: hypothetical protein A3K09_05460 [Nitrospinae bacterium RIFCSPLOWO2_12_FULL_47_7]|nr:MAG: hypothetical protein A3K09_05460 [Nitrospinae bacterium RIFCSPLOWO2_12_FULL_47_7]